MEIRKKFKKSLIPISICAILSSQISYASAQNSNSGVLADDQDSVLLDGQKIDKNQLSRVLKDSSQHKIIDPTSITREDIDIDKYQELNSELSIKNFKDKKKGERFSKLGDFIGLEIVNEKIIENIKHTLTNPPSKEYSVGITGMVDSDNNIVLYNAKNTKEVSNGGLFVHLVINEKTELDTQESRDNSFRNSMKDVINLNYADSIVDYGMVYLGQIPELKDANGNAMNLVSLCGTANNDWQKNVFDPIADKIEKTGEYYEENRHSIKFNADDFLLLSTGFYNTVEDNVNLTTKNVESYFKQSGTAVLTKNLCINLIGTKEMFMKNYKIRLGSETYVPPETLNSFR